MLPCILGLDRLDTHHSICLADQVIRGTINRIIAARTIASDISGRRS
ncbi:hypothetical protein GGP80_003085 [Salinibacter ruber]|nr:hypothetical protein [Salinibacter ruber]